MTQILILSSVLLWIVLVFNFLLTLAIVRKLKLIIPPQMEALKVGQQAPDFAAITLQGGEVTKDTYAQRSVAFVFVSPDCSPCHEVVSEFKTIGKHALNIGLELILVSMANLDITQDYIKETAKGADLPVLVAPQDGNPFTQDYKVSGTPYFCSIDKKGKVQAAGSFAQEWYTIMENQKAIQPEPVGVGY